MDKDYNIFDGAHVETNCTDINRAQFSYNNGVFLLGAAYMYNYVSCRMVSIAGGLLSNPYAFRPRI